MFVPQRGVAATKVWHGHPGRDRFTGWKPVPGVSTFSKQGNESVGAGVVLLIMARSREFVPLAPLGEREEEFGDSAPYKCRNSTHGLEARATRIVAGCEETGK